MKLRLSPHCTMYAQIDKKPMYLFAKSVLAELFHCFFVSQPRHSLRLKLHKYTERASISKSKREATKRD